MGCHYFLGNGSVMTTAAVPVVLGLERILDFFFTEPSPAGSSC